jgi:hypothetical protein
MPLLPISAFFPFLHDGSKKQARMATTGRISASGNTVQNIEQAASILDLDIRMKKNKNDRCDQPEPDSLKDEKPVYFANTRLLTPSEIESMRKDIGQSIQAVKGHFKDLAYPTRRR